MKTQPVSNFLASLIASFAVSNLPFLAPNALAFVASSQPENQTNLQLAQVNYSRCANGPNRGSYCFRLGNRGPLIYELIEDLRRAGYYNVGNDSYYGPVAQRAVRDFQRNVGLTPDGVAGPQTRNLLKNPSYWRY
ncbi:MAG: peptidoglycan-binding domain-containing protein [Oscillatoria sp. PMC 1068.18]|nr:peptidoglycan-binding domain-containing protein [Oscillatoria sp. PMC 1076.18]MEC4987972.1 peptidoglycan-binding domain-containing protein [Oscillatoria sp. PMC 1068.18]